MDRIWGELVALEGGVRFVCIVLDEVDSVFMDKNYSPSDFFYRFLRFNEYIGDSGIRLCLIVIMNNVSTFDENVDARVKSSMGAEMIVFPAYTMGELDEILRSRVEKAFKPGVVEEGALMRCSEYVRIARALLRVSGEVANEHRSNVDVSCVEAAFDRIKKDWMDDIFQSLTISEAMVLLMMALIGQQEEVFTTQDLYRNIKSIKIDEDIRKRIDYKPLSERRVLEILRDLETARARWLVPKFMRCNIVRAG